MVAARSAPLREAVEFGPAPLGPAAPPRERVPALLAATLRFKLDNRHLTLALEEDGEGSPYQAEHYQWFHGVLRDALQALGDPSLDADFTAHALLATVRADLVAHLADRQRTPDEELCARVAEFTERVLGTR